MGNACCSFPCLTDVDLCPRVTATCQLEYPVQCVDNCEGRDGQVVFDSESFLCHFHFTGRPNVPVQCLENPEGENGVIVIGHESFPRLLSHLSRY